MEKNFKINFFISFLGKNINRTTEIPIDLFQESLNNSNIQEGKKKNFNIEYLIFPLEFNLTISDLNKIFSSFEFPINTKICCFNEFFKFKKKFLISINDIEDFLGYTYLTDINLNLKWKNPRIKDKKFIKEIIFGQRFNIHGDYIFEIFDFEKIDSSKIQIKNNYISNNKEIPNNNKDFFSTTNLQKIQLIDFSKYKKEENVDFLIDCKLKRKEKTNILIISKDITNNYLKNFISFQKFLIEFNKYDIYKQNILYYSEKAFKILLQKLKKICEEKNEVIRNALFQDFVDKNENNEISNISSLEKLLIYLFDLLSNINKISIINNFQNIIMIFFNDFFYYSIKPFKINILSFLFKNNNIFTENKIGEILATNQLEIFWFIFKSFFSNPDIKDNFKFILDCIFTIDKKVIYLNEQRKNFYYLKYFNFEDKINSEFLEKILESIILDLTNDKNLFFSNFYLTNIENFHPIYYLLTIKKFRILIKQNKEKFYNIFIEILEIHNKINFTGENQSITNFDYGLLKDFFYNLIDFTEVEFGNQNLLIDLIYINLSKTNLNQFDISNFQYKNSNNYYQTRNLNISNFNNIFSKNDNLPEANLDNFKNIDIFRSIDVFDHNIMNKENEYFINHGKFIRIFNFIKNYTKFFGDYMNLSSNMTFKSDNLNKQIIQKNMEYTYYDENEKNIFIEISKLEFLILIKQKIFNKLQKTLISANNRRNNMIKRSNSNNTNKNNSKDFKSMNNITNICNNMNNLNSNNKNTESYLFLNNDNFDIDSYLDEHEKSDIKKFMNNNLKKIIIDHLIFNDFNFTLEDTIILLYPIYQNFFRDIFIYLLVKLTSNKKLNLKDFIHISDFNFDFIFDLFVNGHFDMEISEKIKTSIENKPILMELFEHKINKQFLEEFVLKNLNNFYVFEKSDLIKMKKNFIMAHESNLNIKNLIEIIDTKFIYKNIYFFVCEKSIKDRILFLKLFFEFDQVNFFFFKFKEYFEKLIINICINNKTQKHLDEEYNEINQSLDIENNIFYKFFNLFFQEFYDLNLINLKLLKVYIRLDINHNDISLNEEDINEKQNEISELKVKSRNNCNSLLNDNFNKISSKDIIMDSFEDTKMVKINTKNNIIEEINKENFFSLFKINFRTKDESVKLLNPNKILIKNNFVKLNQNKNVGILFNQNCNRRFYMTHVFIENPIKIMKKDHYFLNKIEYQNFVRSVVFLGGFGEFPKCSEIEKLKNLEIENYRDLKARIEDENFKYFDRFLYLGHIEFDTENNNYDDLIIKKCHKLYFLDYLFVILIDTFNEKSNYMYCGNIGCFGNFNRDNAEKIFLRDYKCLKEKFLEDNYRELIIDNSKI